MFLTRMTLNAHRRGARKLLGSPQAMHAAVMASFPTSPADGTRVLWRVDDDDAARPLLYLTSPVEPDLTHVVEQAGWPTSGLAWDTRDYRPLLGRLKPEQRWHFRLTANPVRNGMRPGRTETQRFGHVSAPQQVQWLQRRAEGHGFRLAPTGGDEPAVTVIRRGVRSFRRQAATVTLGIATFEGVLQVIDPDRFRDLMVRGIGPAKAYGCGLLTLAPVAAS